MHTQVYNTFCLGNDAARTRTSQPIVTVKQVSVLITEVLRGAHNLQQSSRLIVLQKPSLGELKHTYTIKHKKYNGTQYLLVLGSRRSLGHLSPIINL